MFDGMGDHLIHTPRVDRIPRARQAWQQAFWIADSCFVLLVIAGGLLLMGHETVQTSYSVKDVAPRLVVAFVTANFSSEIIGGSVGFANALAAAIIGPGADPDVAVKVLGDRLSHHIRSGSIFLVILVLVAAFLGCILVVTYAVRVMILLVLLVGGPLALACQALPQTEMVARIWWRVLVAVLLIQVVQSLVFLIALQVLFTPDGSRAFSDKGQLWDMVLVICLLYVLVRVPVWVWHIVVQGAAPRSPAARSGTYMYVLYRLHRTQRTARGARRAARGRGRPAGGRGTGAGGDGRQPRPVPYTARPHGYQGHPIPHQPRPRPAGQPGPPRQPRPSGQPRPTIPPQSQPPSTPPPTRASMRTQPDPRKRS
ncbi:conjugal transfer protein TrbL family protein [Actinomadura rupiterrae]|uniref:conjugal transfer protein TrbL family protein n=1 Tax=Actinomadura rupiterrae TaxID=559627 RepID=UPI0020A30EE4|nr:conjugal transfer protein TrbL family protein [Actinomadura rupiterrae]MCP2337482.1 hypothetical protein [Actinomadura rupiterrae]